LDIHSPEHSQTKSASALSRFLNINPWSTRGLIRIARKETLKQVLLEFHLGRKTVLQVIILTTPGKLLEFKEFEHLIHVYNGKRGYIWWFLLGCWQGPGISVYGEVKAQPPAQLGLKLVQRFRVLKSSFQIMILADILWELNFFMGYVSLSFRRLLVYPLTVNWSMVEF